MLATEEEHAMQAHRRPNKIAVGTGGSRGSGRKPAMLALDTSLT